jgi:hypothetical protein
MVTLRFHSPVVRSSIVLSSLVVAAMAGIGLSGPMRAAPFAPDPITCLPTCTIDGRSLVVAGDDDTTLKAVVISLGLTFSATSPALNFELFDGDANPANWDVLFNGGAGVTAPVPELKIELWADPLGEGPEGGAQAVLIKTWTPGAAASGIEQGPFVTANNSWLGVNLPHDPLAQNGAIYQYAVRITADNPSVNKGWNAFKVRAAGETSLLANNMIAFIAAMNNPGDLETIYPHWFETSPNGQNLSDSPYDGTWSFRTVLPPFIADNLTVFDGDMDFGNAACTYKDTDDPDSSGVPAFSVGAQGAVDEGVASAGSSAAFNCPNGISGSRTGLPADDNNGAAFRRVPTLVPAGIAYRIVAPDGQVFLNRNPSGNREWEQFKIQLVSHPVAEACPVGGFPATPATDTEPAYPAHDCETQSLPGGVWEIQLDGMDVSNLNFWFFSFKVSSVPDYEIGRLVWYDTNKNGSQDAGEPGIPGVVLTIKDGGPDGTPVSNAVTDANGEFLLTMPGGDYTVVVDAENFLPGGPLAGLTSTTGGEVESGIEVGLPICIDTNNPTGCGQPLYAEAIFGYAEEEEEGVGIIAPTSETCQDYASGTAATEYVMTYALTTQNKIQNSVAPGVIFYFTKVTVGAGQTLSVAQSHTGSAPNFSLLANEARVFTTSCGNVSASVSQNPQAGVVTFGALPAGEYILRLKWSGKSLVGAPAPDPSTSYYTFVAQLNGVPQTSTQNATPLALTKR